VGGTSLCVTSVIIGFQLLRRTLDAAGKSRRTPW
jgi:hypothetical protein